VGAGLIFIGIILQIVQLAYSIRHRASLRDGTGDPWNGRSLEWATASPPPAFNFAISPTVSGGDPYWSTKRPDHERAEDKSLHYEDIPMPKNSPTGFICAFFATVMGFALIWHIWWLVVAGGIGAFATFVVFAWRDEDEYIVSAADAERIDQINISARAASIAGQAS
jgi:cytochrome o ubiquinol oxidase subunit I